MFPIESLLLACGRDAPEEHDSQESGHTHSAYDREGI